MYQWEKEGKKKGKKKEKERGATLIPGGIKAEIRVNQSEPYFKRTLVLRSARRIQINRMLYVERDTNIYDLSKCIRCFQIWILNMSIVNKEYILRLWITTNIFAYLRDVKICVRKIVGSIIVTIVVKLLLLNAALRISPLYFTILPTGVNTFRERLCNFPRNELWK